MIPYPTFEREKEYWSQGYTVIGLDEVGRGCLAGPVYVGGTIFLPETANQITSLGIHDSKVLSRKKRALLVPKITQYAHFYAIESSSCEAINSKGIVMAITQAFKAVLSLLHRRHNPEKVAVFLDGRPLAALEKANPYIQVPIIKGDRTSVSIAAASILAKEARDAYMRNLAQTYPEYCWDRNVGYATNTHCEALRKHGPTNHHRTLFIRNVISKIPSRT